MLNFLILGPLRAYEGNEQVPLGSFKRQVLLGLLLCRANRIVPVTTLTEALWDDAPPRTAHKNLQMQVSALRKMFAPAADASSTSRPWLVHTPPGYTLRVGTERLDLLRFKELARAGRRAVRVGETAVACDLLGQAVRLWRGQVLPDLTSVNSIAAEAQTLEEQFLSAYEDLAEAKLTLGHHAELLEGLDELTHRHPYRERLRHVQMLALYRCGRQTEALARYDEVRQRMAREFGIRPSPVLTRLYESILVGDRGLDAATVSQLTPVSVRASTRERTNLARDIPDFTGRAQELNALASILGDEHTSAVVTIAGPVGVGKTALAVHCAYRLGRAFPQGRVLTTLRSPDGRPRPASEVLGDLLRGMRVAEPPGVGPTERIALLHDATAGRRMLFILDDAGTEAQVREVLGALAVASNSSVIITSRSHLSGLESTSNLTIDTMSDDDALGLLGRLIGEARLAAEPEAVGRLLEICGGLPLLVRIVGAKLSGLRHLSLARYAGRFADEHHVLDQLEAGELRIRSRLTVSLQDLTPGNQTVLRRLALLPEGTFTAAEAAGQLGTDVLKAEAALERLLDAHLVAAHLVAASSAEVEAHADGSGVRYCLPWPIRVFARETRPS